MIYAKQTTWVLLLTALSGGGVEAAQCTAESGPQRVPLLELYTSEGCNSCPPVDRWVSGLLDRQLAPAGVVVLGFHVDYWDDLGWRDPFAQARHTERQRSASRRNRARVVYTPQLVLNGRDYRRGRWRDDFEKTASELRTRPPAARLSLAISARENRLDVEGAFALVDSARGSDARAYVAVYENGLSTEVRAGENRGRTLRHDFVVRELAGPFPAGGRFAHRFALGNGWDVSNLHVAAFVQDERSGDVLQALDMRHCAAARARGA